MGIFALGRTIIAPTLQLTATGTTPIWPFLMVTGKILSDCCEWWTKQFTGGQGNYCMIGMDDTGTLTALSRLAAVGRVDLNRVMVLRTASDFDQQYSGQIALQSLQADSGGHMLAIQNACRAGSVVTQHIIKQWDEWKDGVPQLP